MTIWFTADHHFGHARILQYCDRPFANVTEMDDALIRNWNERIHREDTVYHLGDFCMGGIDMAWRYLARLNGYIFFVPGGHDRRWCLPKNCPNGCNWDILPQLVETRIEGRTFVLCHYPMAQWEKSRYGAWHLHGHSHGKMGLAKPADYRVMAKGIKPACRVDVGVDAWNFYPVPLEAFCNE